MANHRAPPRFAIWCAATTVYWCGLAVIMHVPPSPALAGPSWLSFPHVDKVVHGILYAILGMMLSLTVAAYHVERQTMTAQRSKSTALRIFGVIAAYGLLDELTQPLTGRNLDAWDYATDLAAAAVGIAVVWAFRRDRSANS